MSGTWRADLGQTATTMTLRQAVADWKRLVAAHSDDGEVFAGEELETILNIIDRFYFPEPGEEKWSSTLIQKVWVAKSAHGTKCIHATVRTEDGTCRGTTYGAKHFKSTVKSANHGWFREQFRDAVQSDIAKFRAANDATDNDDVDHEPDFAETMRAFLEANNNPPCVTPELLLAWIEHHREVYVEGQGGSLTLRTKKEHVELTRERRAAKKN